MSSEDEAAYGPPLPPGFKSKPGEGKGNCGPSLPPHLVQSSKQKNTNSVESSGDNDSSDSDSYGSALPPHLGRNSPKKKDCGDSDDACAYIPALPPSLQRQDLKRKSSEGEAHLSKFTKTDSEDDEDMYGPALPPHLMKNKNNPSSLASGERIKGPTLPPGFVLPESLPSFEVEEEDESDEEIGPVVGPVPSAVAFNEAEYRAEQFELRAKRMKDKLEGKFDESKAVKRETWMLELPENKPNFCGLAPRQFRKKAPQPLGDRSVWTDTPEDKERKAKMETEEVIEEKEAVNTAVQQQQEDLTARIEQYNKDKRAKPLIDLHKKKLKEKDDASGPKERRPFSREDDMNVNKFDDAQKETILKKARQLNDRFSAGDRKFL